MHINSLGIDSNCDIQNPTDPEAVNNYIKKYLTKGEKDSNDITYMREKLEKQTE